MHTLVSVLWCSPCFQRIPFKNIFDFTTAGDWDCVAAVERLPALHYKCRFYFLVFWDHGFHCGTFVMDVKVIPGEKCALQHQLLVCDIMIDMPPKIKRRFTPRPKVWKLRDPQTCSRFQEVIKAHVSAVETEAATTTEENWAKLKTGLLKTTEEVCGTTKPHRWRRETWWWNKEVDDAITAKRQADGEERAGFVA